MTTIKFGQPSIPHPDGDDEKEVFSFVGFASFVAQGLEAELVNIGAGLALSEEDTLTNEQIDALFDSHEKLTLGSLLKRVRTKLTLAGEAESAILFAVDERNRLIHHFFRQHASHFLTPACRRLMIEDLRSLAKTLLEADSFAAALSNQLWTLRGVSVEAREAFVRQMMTDAKGRDQLDIRQ